jgi:aminoglycoside phosphotransferase (APT) family kinase protein
MIEQHDVAAYLLARRLIGRRSIVSGTLRIEDVSSRNRNVRVSGGPGESYLLKQGLAADSAHTLANEAAVYRRLTAAGAGWIPRLHASDRARGVLILEWIAGGTDLARRGGATVALAGALGRVLAELHAIAPDAQELRRDAPWVLALHRPPLEALRYSSAASVELVKRLQADAALGAALDGLREGWRATALVHRDVKWANCIAHGARATRLALVDWEMAGWGDPAGDVGAALGACAGRPAQARALWRAYVRAGGEPSLLQRAAGHAGARLVQTAYEHTQEAPALDEATIEQLALARELLVEPRAAAAAHLGLAP